MKIAKTLFLLAATSLSAMAQISINANEIVVPISPDTAKGIEVITPVIAVPTVGANQTWSYASLTGTQKSDFTFAAPDNNPNFINATAKFDIDIYLGPILISDTREYYVNDASGTYYMGIELAAKQYNIDGLTGGTGDQLDVANTHNNFGTTLPRIKFPLQFGSQWTNDYLTTMDFNITVNSVGLINEPGQMKRYYVEEYEVVGWGEVDLPAQLGNRPGLLLKSKITIIDSLYLNGAPANPVLLAGLGLSQGFITEFAFYDIFIKGLNRSAIQFEMEPNFASVYNANYCKMETTMGMAENTQVIAQVYPNPSTEGHVELSFLKPTAKAWQINIVDVTGKIVFEKNTTQTGHITLQLNLPQAAGIYFCTIVNEAGKQVYSEKIVRK